MTSSINSIGSLENLSRREVAIVRARRHLIDFTTYTMPTYRVNWHHRLIASKLERVRSGEIKRLMIFAPPRHGKSELSTRRFPAWCLGLNPDEKIQSWSYSDDSAKEFNRDNQRIIMSPNYVDVFPRTRLNSRNVVTFADDKTRRNSRIFDVIGADGYYQGAGTGGMFTGKGGTLLLCDDPIKNYEEAYSKTKRDRIWDFYRSTFYTRGEGAFAEGGDVRIVITMTRWHEDDLAGRLLREAAANPDVDQWDVVSLPAVLDVDPMEDDNREHGEPLWPAKYTLDKLRSIKATTGARDWNALYQQRPSSPEGGMFKRHWWRRYRETPQLQTMFWSCDMTFKETTSGSYVVLQLWGRAGPNFYLLHQIRERMDFVQTLACCEREFAAWPGATLKLIEDKANGPAVISALRQRFSGLVAVTPKGSKEARAASVSPVVEGGNVWLPDDAPWVGDFIDELAAFPKGAHDDQVDAMSQGLDHQRSTVQAALEALTTM